MHEIEIAALKRTVSKLNVLQASIVTYRENLDTRPSNAEMRNSINDCLEMLQEVKLPRVKSRVKSRVVDLTDAGPGVINLCFGH